MSKVALYIAVQDGFKIRAVPIRDFVNSTREQLDMSRMPYIEDGLLCNEPPPDQLEFDFGDSNCLKPSLIHRL